MMGGETESALFSPSEPMAMCVQKTTFCGHKNKRVYINTYISSYVSVVTHCK